MSGNKDLRRAKHEAYQKKQAAKFDFASLAQLARARDL